jgi:putative ABC transport system permease protein
MDASLASSIATERLLTALLLAFASMALALAMTGLYGVISYSVAQRTREIGTRMALGADQRAVLRLVVGEGFRLTIIGVIAGALAAAAASRALRGLLFEVSPADPLIYVVVMVLFGLTACTASIVPARRALRVDPQAALRAN